MKWGYFQVEHGEQKDMSAKTLRSHRTMEGFLQGPLQRSATGKDRQAQGKNESGQCFLAQEKASVAEHTVRKEGNPQSKQGQALEKGVL